MDELFLVFLELTFMGRLRLWDTDSQIEIDALQTLLRRFGLEALFGAQSGCLIEKVDAGPADDPRLVTFCYKLRGGWTRFYLEVRDVDVLVLWDRAPR